MTNNLLRKNKCPLKGAKKGHKFGSTRRKLILVDTIQKAYNTRINNYDLSLYPLNNNDINNLVIEKPLLVLDRKLEYSGHTS